MIHASWRIVLVLCVVFGLGIFVGQLGWFGSGGAGGIGYVDLDQVFKKSDQAKQLQKELDAAQEAAKKVITEEQAKVDAARLRVSPSVFAGMMEQAKKVVEAKQKELMTLSETLSRKLEKQIRELSTRVASRRGLKVVAHKRAILSGGEDLTQEVLKALQHEQNRPKTD